MIEMAIVTPILTFVFVAGVDYARLFYASQIVTNCAYNGAVYGSRATVDPSSQYGSLQAAALADAANLSPTPTVDSTTGVDTNGNSYFEASVSYPFQTVIPWPGIAEPTLLKRTVRMQMAPNNPS